MNTLKTGLVALGLMIGASVVAQDGREGKTPEERAQFRTEKIAAELELTDAQKTKFAEISKASDAKKEAIKSDASLTEEQKREAFKANHEASKAQMKEVLTAEQLAKLEAKKAEHRGQHAGKKGEGKHEARTAEEKAKMRTDRMTKEVSLTEEQQTKMTALNLSAIKKEEAVRNNTALTEDQKKEKMKEIREAQKSDFEALLSDEQKAALKDKKEHDKKDHGKKGTRMCNKPQQPAPAPEK